MKKITIKNVTTHSLPLMIRTVDSSKVFVITIPYNKEVEIFDTQLTPDVEHKLSRRFISLTEYEDFGTTTSFEGEEPVQLNRKKAKS